LPIIDPRAASFEKAHQLDPKFVPASIALGQISAEMKDFASARKYYEEALELRQDGQYTQTATATHSTAN